MNHAKPLPPMERLHELLTLDVENGFLFWKKRSTDSGFYTQQTIRRFNANDAGKRADRLYARRLYYVVKICLRSGEKQESYAAHRIIWKMVNGRDPVPLVDHIDRNKLNNKPGNLREGNFLLNGLNRGVNEKGKNLPIGVYVAPNGRFMSRITLQGRLIHLGTFDTPDEATSAYEAEWVRRDGERAKEIFETIRRDREASYSRSQS